MKHIIPVCICILISLQPSCGKKPDGIASGTWNYRLLVNGLEIGSASVSNTIKNNYYVNETKMEMSVAQVKNTTHQIITETKNFKPVKYEVYNTIINEKERHKIDTVAEFTGNTVKLTRDGETITQKISTPFILDGNYFMNEMIKQKFKQGLKISARIYDPALEPSEPVNVCIKVLGKETITINNNEVSCIHINQIIENLKSIDIYLNNRGITQKAVISMLNNKFELQIK